MAKQKLEPKISLAVSPEEAALRGTDEKRFLIDDVPEGDELPEAGGASYFAVALVALFCFLLAVAGFFMLQRLNQAEAALLAEQQRMSRVEDKLQITDASMLEASDKTVDKFKELEFEIRKLWDNVWKKAKTQLSDHDKSIKSLSSAQKKALAASAQDRELLAQLDTAQKAAQASLAAQGKAFEQRLAKLEADAATDQAQLNVRLSELERTIADTERRLTENEEWIKSTNAFRRQVIKDLRYLRKSVQGLQRYHPQAGSATSNTISPETP